MASIKIRKFRSVDEVNHFLAGGILGGAHVPTLGSFQDLVGKTITFTAPAGNKTFTQPAGKLPGQMNFKDVKTQLEAAIAGLKVVQIAGYVGFVNSTPGTAVTLGSVDEPARLILGLVNNAAIAGLVLNDPGGANPKFLSMYAQGDAIYVTSQE